MDLWMIPGGILALLIAIPVALLSGLGVFVLALKIIALVQKAAEPPTVDTDGQYSLDQGKEVGRQD